MYGAQYADMIGAENVVIFDTDVTGFQLAADAEEKAAELLGINVLDRIVVPVRAVLVPDGGTEDRRPQA